MHLKLQAAFLLEIYSNTHSTIQNFKREFYASCDIAFIKGSSSNVHTTKCNWSLITSYIQINQQRGSFVPFLLSLITLIHFYHNLNHNSYVSQCFLKGYFPPKIYYPINLTLRVTTVCDFVFPFIL